MWVKPGFVGIRRKSGESEQKLCRSENRWTGSLGAREITGVASDEAIRFGKNGSMVLDSVFKILPVVVKSPTNYGSWTADNMEYTANSFQHRRSCTPVGGLADQVENGCERGNRNLPSKFTGFGCEPKSGRRSEKRIPLQEDIK